MSPRGSSPAATGLTTLTRWFVYDEHQRLCKTIEPETQTTVMDYDAAGNLAWSVAGQNMPGTSAADCANDRVAAYALMDERVLRTYDARNRIATMVFSDANGNQIWSYTNDGLPAQIETFNDGGATSVINAYTYNSRRLMTGESQVQAGRPTWTMGYGYNLNGHLQSHVYPDGLTIDYAPNALGQATQAGQFATGVSYWPSGAVRQFTYGNGITHEMLPNVRGLPEHSVDRYGTMTPVLDDSYDYDPNGNVLAITDGLPLNRGNRDMMYDGLNRLRRTESAMFGADPVIRYDYDAIDNIRRVREKNTDLSYYYDPRNQLTNIYDTFDPNQATVGAIGYDARGNVQNKDGDLFTFDRGNRLRAANNRENYRYDGLGRRVTATIPGGASIWSMYGEQGVLRYQEDARKGSLLRYVYLAGSLIAEQSLPQAGGTAEVVYQHTDALGSPVVTTDANRLVLERSEYSPFGELLNRAISDGPGYTGHVMDAATGMTYMQQRYYDLTIGRFLSVDPVTAYSGDMRFFNRFAYGFNNPYRFTDPDGRRAADEEDHIDSRSVFKHPSAKYDSGVIATRNTTGGGGRSNSRQSGGSEKRSVAGQVKDAVVGYAEDVAKSAKGVTQVTGAKGVGATLSHEINFYSGQQKVDLAGVIGEGFGGFMGFEADLATFEVPGFENAPVFFDSVELKAGEGFAGGLKLQFNPGGQLTVKGFLGLGYGGEVTVNKPASIGVNLWTSEP